MESTWREILKTWLAAPQGAFSGVRYRPAEHPLLDTQLCELELKVRTRNCLINEDFRSVREILEHTPAQLLARHNFGRYCLNDLVRALEGLEAKEPKPS